MKKYTYKLLTALLSIWFCLSGTIAVAASDNKLQTEIKETVTALKKEAGSDTDTLLSDNTRMPAGTSLCDWIALVLALSGEKDDYSGYLKQLEAYVTDQYKSKGCLDTVKATEYHRMILVVKALGGNPEAFGKTPEQQNINLVSDGIYDFHGESLSLQGANGFIYGLLALDSNDYVVPAEAAFTREHIIKELLAIQNDAGAFSLSDSPGENGNVDITAMALQALAPYIQQPEVASAIDSALDWLASEITENGAFISYGAESSESISQTILALCALGIDPAADERFQNTHGSLFDALQAFRTEDGLYMHSLSDKEGNILATQQALLALEATLQFRENGTWIFDFTNYEKVNNTVLIPIYVPIIVGLLIITFIIVILHYRKNYFKSTGKE